MIASYAEGKKEIVQKEGTGLIYQDDQKKVIGLITLQGKQITLEISPPRKKKSHDSSDCDEEEIYRGFSNLKMTAPVKKESDCKFSDYSLKEGDIFDPDVVKMLNSPGIVSFLFFYLFN
jgi:hypothetical protein